MLKKLRLMALILLASFLLAAAGAYPVVAAPAADGADQQEWEFIIPTGEIEKTSVDPAPRIKNLDGKTIALRWNGKNNGDVFLDHLAVLLHKKYPSAKIVKTYEMEKSLNTITGANDVSMKVTEFIKKQKPDLVIAAQAD
ncbi:MAG: hypothetical protein LBN33_02525 [Desulfovibrio sp.]|jgi:hypothetical protein|nr:hypothetical protein [Desulfovibrio sp.]